MLTGAGLLVGRVLDYEGVGRDPQVLRNRPFVETTRPSGAGALTPRLPYVLDGQDPGPVTPPPPLGADSRAVLAELGVPEAEAESLIARGIVSSGEQAGGQA
ncbi:MAG TPA: hypothetical protein VGH27_11575 [Streptosporangiaceae bacterium]